MFLKKKSYLIAVIAIVCLLLIVIIKIASLDSSIHQIPKPVVVIGKLSKGQIQHNESLTGDMLPIQQASIYSKVNGNIDNIFVDIGSRVSSHQILALIDTTIYSQNANQAKANYKQAQASYQNAKVFFERNKILLEQNYIAQQDYENAKTALDVAFAQQEAAEAVYNNAVTQLSYCKIIAPFSGIITKRNFDSGSYITATTNNQGSVLFTLMNMDRLKTVVYVPERSVPFLPEVKEVTIIPDAFPDKNFNARITKISQAIDPGTRAMAVEIEIDNTGLLLKPGMFATVQFVTDIKSDSYIIPSQVALNDEQGDFVFVVNPDTTISKKYFKIGTRTDDKLEVLSGLTETDQIVFIGQTLIKDKMKVKIAKQ